MTTEGTIYLAGRYSRREELCGYKADLEARGFKVPARWLLGAHQITDAGLALGAELEAAFEDEADQRDHILELRAEFAMDDWEDVTSAGLLVAFTEPPRSDKGRGGRHVEFGIALGLSMPILVVGPRENIFCCLPQVTVYPDWQAALADPRLTGRLALHASEQR
jgi:hypothetical protein